MTLEKVRPHPTDDIIRGLCPVAGKPEMTRFDGRRADNGDLPPITPVEPDAATNLAVAQRSW